ncbi:MAG: DNA primase [Agromyces sp.]
MAGRIRASDIDEVNPRTNILDVVGDHVQLKSAGVGSYKGLCPFHDEKSPSFHVRPQVGYYHCFGCGESGDVYTFLQKLDHVTFTEAVERLAAKLGMQLHYEEGGPANDGPNRARLYAANQAAAEYFQAQLKSPGAAIGRTFLGERGFDAAAAAQFGIGFAPAGWDNLTKHLSAAGYKTDELVAAGLVSQGDRGVYDRFRGRLVWPIRDVTGQTVGFGARKLLDDDQGPKYLNTPETPIYHKAQVLYGLDLAKRDIAKTNQVVVVEGYTDVMACHLAGVTTAVATCGTAFGSDHLKLLKRVLPSDGGLGEVVFTFDPDAAGQKAALRAFTEARSVAAQTYIAVGPDGLDPCDLRLAKGEPAVRAMIDARTPMFEYVMRHHVNQYDLSTVEGRVAGMRAAAVVLADIRDPMMRGQYAHELARMVGMDRGEVERAVNSAAKAASAPAVAPSAPLAEAPASSAPVATQYRLRDLPADPSTRLERDALQVLLQHPDVLPAELRLQALDCQFRHPALAVIRDGIAATSVPLGTAEGQSALRAELPAEFVELADQLAVAPLPEREHSGPDGLALYAKGVLASLVERELLRQKAELLSRLQRTPVEDRDAYRQLQSALQQIEVDRRRIREEDGVG